MFCFCSKDKSAAIFMAFANLIVGVLGIFYFAPKVYNQNNDLDSDYLCFSVASLVAAGCLGSALIWEKPTLVSVYQVLQISVMSIFVAHIIFFRTCLIFYFQLVAPCLCFLLYCMYCTYNYSIQMRLKIRTRIGVIRIYRTDSMCFCNRYSWGNNLWVSERPAVLIKQRIPEEF